MTFDKQFPSHREYMINETLLNSYCEWVWYNVTENTITPKVILPNGILDDDNPEYHLMYHKPKCNQMCLMKFTELFLPEDYIEKQENEFKKIMFPYYILIVSLGLLGNCLLTCVLFGTKLRYSSPSVYLGALAISDNCYLITMLARRYLNLNNFFSKFSIFSTNFCACLSAWIVIVFTVERFIAIKWPLRRNSFCTVARAKIIIIILTILSFLVNIPDIPFVHTLSDSSIYWLCQTVIIIIIPVIMITMFNILILYNIYKSYRNRKNLTELFITCSKNRNYQNWMSQAKIFLVSFAFMFFNMPICVRSIISYSLVVDQTKQNTYNIFKNINRNNGYPFVIYTLDIMRHEQVLKTVAVWGVITEDIYNINFSINFLLYCVSGKNIRKELVDMFKKSVNQLQNFYIHITNR